MLHLLIVEKLPYVLFLKGAFSDVLEGVGLRIFWGQAPRAPFSSALPPISCYITVRNAFPNLLNTIQHFPVNSTINEIFIGQLPKCKAKSYTPTNEKC